MKLWWELVLSTQLPSELDIKWKMYRCHVILQQQQEALDAVSSSSAHLSSDTLTLCPQLSSIPLRMRNVEVAVALGNLYRKFKNDRYVHTCVYATNTCSTSFHILRFAIFSFVHPPLTVFCPISLPLSLTLHFTPFTHLPSLSHSPCISLLSPTSLLSFSQPVCRNLLPASTQVSRNDIITT